MSWFARSIANTFKLEEDDDSKSPLNIDNSPQSPERGVKEDLSEITKTLTRQFWGVASFIAPPLPAGDSNDQPESSDPDASVPEPIDGIRRDFAEIRGKFRSGISKLSNNIDVSEITKLASNFLQLESDDDDEDNDCDSNDGDCAVGVTDEVVDFAKDIAMHPETWLNFPLPHEEDFDMSDAQQEHALAVERLAPRLGALRIELCPSYMSESSFWKIYFVLLHPRLEHNAAELLSTSTIVKARASLSHELKNRCYSENMSDSYSESSPVEVSAIETIKHPIGIDEIQIEIVNKSVIKEEPQEESNHEDDWLKEESSETVCNRVAISIEKDEDVSFSDLEDDDDDDDSNIPIHYKNIT